MDIDFPETLHGAAQDHGFSLASMVLVHHKRMSKLVDKWTLDAFPEDFLRDIDREGVLATMGDITARINAYSIVDRNRPLYRVAAAATTLKRARDGVNVEEGSTVDKEGEGGPVMRYPPLGLPGKAGDARRELCTNIAVGLCQIWLGVRKAALSVIAVAGAELVELNVVEHGHQFFSHAIPGCLLVCAWTHEEEGDFVILIRQDDTRLAVSNLGGHPTATTIHPSSGVLVSLLNSDGSTGDSASVLAAHHTAADILDYAVRVMYDFACNPIH